MISCDRSVLYAWYGRVSTKAGGEVHCAGSSSALFDARVNQREIRVSSDFHSMVVLVSAGRSASV